MSDLEIAVAIVCYLAVINSLTWFLFAWDKRCARGGKWRQPESRLLRLALLGGSPAAIAAQRILRHKTRKEPFSTVLRWIALFHVAALATAALFAASDPIAGALRGDDVAAVQEDAAAAVVVRVPVSRDGRRSESCSGARACLPSSISTPPIRPTPGSARPVLPGSRRPPGG